MTSQDKDPPTSKPSDFGAHRQGDPDVPEERNPRGHDARPEDAQGRAGADEHRTDGGSTVPHVGAPPAAPAPKPSPVADAKFLTDEFGIDEKRAAALVASGRGETDSAGKIEAGLRKAEAQEDPLAGVPTPEEPASDVVPDNDEERLKPVIHGTNNRTGAG